MPLAEARQYIASIDGSSDDADALVRAGRALSAAMNRWSLKHRWRFLLLETSYTLVTDAMAQGAAYYRLPETCIQPLTLRLTNTSKKPLIYVDPVELDRKVPDQSTTGVPVVWTLYRGTTDFDASSATGQAQIIRLYPTPSDSTEVMVLRYYRKMNPLADPVDIVDVDLYALLDWARYEYLVVKNSEDARLSLLLRQAMDGYRDALQLDMDATIDYDVRLIASDEIAGWPGGAGGALSAGVTTTGDVFLGEGVGSGKKDIDIGG